MTIIEEKLKALATKTSNWVQKAQWRILNEDWLEISAFNAMRILTTLREQKITKEELAENIGVSIEEIQTLLKGSTKFTKEIVEKINAFLKLYLHEN